MASKTKTPRLSVVRSRVADRVWRITVRAAVGANVVGVASGDVGDLPELIRWRRDSGAGGWASDEWKMFSDKERVGYFSSVYVDHQQRGRGIGRDLAVRLVREMDKLKADAAWLSVVPMDEDTDGSSLVALYTSIGFRPVAVKGRDEDRPVMVRRADDVVVREEKQGNQIVVVANLRGDVSGAAFAVGFVGDEKEVAGALWDIQAKVAPAEVEAAPGTYGYVGRLYVPGRWRKRGIGRKLATAIVRRMIALGAVDVFLESASENESFSDDDLVGFYERLGFRRHEREPYGNLLHLQPGIAASAARMTNPRGEKSERGPRGGSAAREAAGVFVVARSSGRVLLVRRAPHVSTPGVWGMPAGKIELDESPQDAAARELHEETGVYLPPLSLRFAFSCRTPEGGVFWAFVGCADREVPVMLGRELDAFRWVEIEEDLPGPMHPEIVRAASRRTVRDGMASAIRSALECMIRP